MKKEADAMYKSGAIKAEATMSCSLSCGATLTEEDSSSRMTVGKLKQKLAEKAAAEGWESAGFGDAICGSCVAKQPDEEDDGIFDDDMMGNLNEICEDLG